MHGVFYRAAAHVREYAKGADRIAAGRESRQAHDQGVTSLACAVVARNNLLAAEPKNENDIA